MAVIDTFEPFAQLGVAGLMGALWLWERIYSRRREQELSEAHQKLIAQREELDTLIVLVRRNTSAIERFEQTQSKLADLIDRLGDGRFARRQQL